MGNWQRVPAGLHVQFTRGVSWTAERERDSPTSSTHRVLTIPNVQTHLVLDEVMLVDFPGGVLDKWRATPGSIVMVGSNGNPRRVGNAIQILPEDGDFLFASFLIAAKAGSRDLNERYLFHCLKSGGVQDLISRSVQGSTGLSNLSMDFLRGLPIPLPPLEEQRRIAEILDTIDETIQTTDRVIAKRRALRAGLAADLLKGPSAIAPSSNSKPNETMPLPASTSTSRSWGMGNWQRVPAGLHVQFTRGVSWTAERERDSPTSSTHRVLTIPNVQTHLVLDEVMLVDFPGGVLDKWRATPGSIVMVGSNGNPRRVGNAIQILPEDGDFLFASFLIAAKAGSRDLNERYLFHCLKSGGVQDLISRSVQGSTGLSNLSMDFLRGLPIPLPPLEEQRRIAKILDTVDGTIQQNEAELAKLGKLRAGLAADLLSGCVRTVAA